MIGEVLFVRRHPVGGPGLRVLDDLAALGYRRGVGPGVWDIHSPRLPSRDEVVEALRRAVAAVPAGRLWVNPDYGPKTRGYLEVAASLRHLVAAAEVRRCRAELDRVPPGPLQRRLSTRLCSLTSGRQRCPAVAGQSTNPHPSALGVPKP
ncbi:hypothetical protein ACH4T9_03020 [Micromonospora sp. NPDC020750]|uniref:hypothetical protein n=1 Tax=unclassified Micromonospora TaxID=2617518 RepID=UPI0037AADDAA